MMRILTPTAINDAQLAHPLMILSHAFRPDVIGSADAFKIPTLRASPTYVSQRLADIWLEAGVTGVSFSFVWSRN